MGSTLTEREMDVMAVLWDRGSATVSEVLERLDDDLAYTTVLTILRILEDKGVVKHEKEGRAHRFHPLMDREEAGQSFFDRLREKVFAGSTELMVSQLVSNERLTVETLERLQRLLDVELDQRRSEEE